MLNTTENLIQAGFGQRLIRDKDLAQLFGGTDARRYGLVNKALRAKELIRLRRGLYVIAPKYAAGMLNEYYLANQMVANSFITAETALSFHGWIPERVTTIISLAPQGRSQNFLTPMGQFVYRVSSIAPQEFLKGVRLIDMGGKSIWMATPLRALLDYVYWNNLTDVNLNFIHESLRVELDDIVTMTPEQFMEVKSVYPQQRMQKFLVNLENEIANATSDY